jgi:type II secretory pathway pseudopilin PulG
LNKKTQKSNESGFSLIELLIVSVIVVFIIGMIGAIVTGIQRSYSQQGSRTQSLNDSTAALDMMTRLIRTAGNNPNGISGLQPIDPGTADGSGIYRTIRVRSDWRGSTISSLPNGNVNDPFEDVIFSVSNNKLMKKEPNDSNPVEFLDNVSSMQFIYYDTNNAMITNPVTNQSQITRIDITVIVSPTGTTPMTFTSSAFLRQR